MVNMVRDTLAWAEAERDVRDGEGRKTPRRFLDFEVNAVPLGPAVREAGYDLISCLWVDNATAAAESAKAARRLLGQLEADAPGGRVVVYGCAECGHLGCGAVTVDVTISKDTVRWSEWGYQTDYEDEVQDVDDINGLRDFEFARPDHERALSAAMARIGHER